MVHGSVPVPRNGSPGECNDCECSWQCARGAREPIVSMALEDAHHGVHCQTPCAINVVGELVGALRRQLVWDSSSQRL